MGDELEETLWEIQHEKDQVERAHRKSKTTNLQLKNENDSLMTELQDEKRKVENQQEEMNCLKKQIHLLQKEKKQVELNLKLAEEKSENLTDECKKLFQENLTQKQKIEALNENIRKIETLLQHSEDKLSEKDELIDRLTMEAQQKRHLESQLFDLQDQYNYLIRQKNLEVSNQPEVEVGTSLFEEMNAVGDYPSIEELQKLKQENRMLQESYEASNQELHFAKENIKHLEERNRNLEQFFSDGSFRLSQQKPDVPSGDDSFLQMTSHYASVISKKVNLLRADTIEGQRSMEGNNTRLEIRLKEQELLLIENQKRMIFWQRLGLLGFTESATLLFISILLVLFNTVYFDFIPPT